jgi:hypothetical protein
MLQNVVDMTDVLHDYVIDLETIPPPFLTPEETGMKETAVQ